MRLKVPMHQPESHCSIVARKRSNVRGAKGAGHLRQDGVNGQPEELLVLAEAGRLPRGGTSRMSREVHVRICEGLGVQAPGPTRRSGQPLSLPRHRLSAHSRAFRNSFRRLWKPPRKRPSRKLSAWWPLARRRYARPQWQTWQGRRQRAVNRTAGAASGS